jgi:hypothetical protein
MDCERGGKSLTDTRKQVSSQAENLGYFHRSSFIVDCSFVIVEWRGSGNGK